MKDCRRCIFFENCSPHYRDCDAYSPYEEDDTEMIIEERRKEFNSEWYIYIKEYD